MPVHLCAVCDECDAETHYPHQSMLEAFDRWSKRGWIIEDEYHGTLCPACRRVPADK